MIAVLSHALPPAMIDGLVREGVPQAVARQVAALPPVSSLFAAFLGLNPLEQLLRPTGVLVSLSASQRASLTGTSLFPNLIAVPFHRGLVAVFGAGTTLSLLAAAASFMRGPRANLPHRHTPWRTDVA